MGILRAAGCNEGAADAVSISVQKVRRGAVPECNIAKATSLVMAGAVVIRNSLWLINYRYKNNYLLDDGSEPRLLYGHSDSRFSGGWNSEVNGNSEKPSPAERERG
jgi:hypothetical protein